MAKASKENKRVLLALGGSWPGDCYALDYGFHQPRTEPLLIANFKLLQLDLGRFARIWA